ncbi:sensor protein QseC [mine drainage metagenome]|uniref:histidine kinase n=1 Tax=mine drainage metagenome TaxID=410659 RepID=A0A1J5RFH1_9ZZZZ
MSRSLERHLSRTLALAIVVAGLLAGAVSFGFAYVEAQEFQDDTLQQIAVLADAKRLPDAGRAVPSADSDPEEKVLVMHLPPDPGTVSPAWLPAALPPGFHTLGGDDRWRVFVRQTRAGTRIAVAQETQVRDEMAIFSALRTLAPLLLLLPLLVWLTVRIVRTELAPVKSLAQNLDEQPARRPQPLPDGDVPDEIAPFVRAINRLLARITELMSEQRRFIADAAHELRSPLTALSLQAQNLENAGSPAAMRERVGPLRAGIERARRLTEQLLSLARSQAAVATSTRLEVSQLAQELIEDALPLAQARGIDLGLEDEGGIVLAADAATLQLIAKNALDNALRYTPAGGEVTLRLHSEDDDALIEVIDSGPGIAEAERERVFSPFYRSEGAGGEGSGLGLAIARDAAQRLGGTVSLHDRPDGPGLLFRYRQRRIAPQAAE